MKVESSFQQDYQNQGMPQLFPSYDSIDGYDLFLNKASSQAPPVSSEFSVEQHRALRALHYSMTRSTTTPQVFEMDCSIAPPPGLEHSGLWSAPTYLGSGPLSFDGMGTGPLSFDGAFTNLGRDKTFPEDAAPLPPHPLSSPGCPQAMKKEKNSSAKKASREQKKIESNGQAEATTLMIRNVPCRLTQQELLQLLDKSGFEERYDFVHLPVAAPMQRAPTSNLGYCFINFTEPEFAKEFQTAFEGSRLGVSCSAKQCAIGNAYIQGLSANLRHFKRATVNSSRHKPYMRITEKNSHVFENLGLSTKEAIHSDTPMSQDSQLEAHRKMFERYGMAHAAYDQHSKIFMQSIGSISTTPGSPASQDTAPPGLLTMSSSFGDDLNSLNTANDFTDQKFQSWSSDDVFDGHMSVDAVCVDDIFESE
jgi:hypothetical protein